MTSLDETVAGLCNYGLPHLMMHDDRTWSCCVKLATNVAGAVFEVKAAFNKHKTPQAAAEECLQRILQAVHSFEFKR